MGPDMDKYSLLMTSQSLSVVVSFGLKVVLLMSFLLTPKKGDAAILNKISPNFCSSLLHGFNTVIS